MAQHGLNPKVAELKPDDMADMSLCKKLDESGFLIASSSRDKKAFKPFKKFKPCQNVRASSSWQ
jgi:hypothetical protein